MSRIRVYNSRYTYVFDIIIHKLLHAVFLFTFFFCQYLIPLNENAVSLPIL